MLHRSKQFMTAWGYINFFILCGFTEHQRHIIKSISKKSATPNLSEEEGKKGYCYMPKIPVRKEVYFFC